MASCQNCGRKVARKRKDGFRWCPRCGCLPNGHNLLREGEPESTTAQKSACRSMGTKQCAAICLSNLPTYDYGECPYMGTVWTDSAIGSEAKRRPNGPLHSFIDLVSVDGLHHDA